MKKSRITRSFSILAWCNSKIGYVPNSYRNHIDTDWNKVMKEDREWHYHNDMGIKYHWKNKKNQRMVDKFLNKTIELTCINKYEKLEKCRGVLHKDEEGLYCVSDVLGSTWFELFQVKDIKLIERD